MKSRKGPYSPRQSFSTILGPEGAVKHDPLLREYMMGIAQKDEDPITHARDDFYEFDGVTLVVDDDSISKLKGSTIDYRESVDKISFVISNPNKPI